MQPNTNNSPLLTPHPVVPDVPQVPDAPQIPQTPATPPKITGVSLPAGSYRKNESPTQRSEKINAANAPKPKPIQKERLLHKPVTMEEIEEYRKKSASKKRLIFTLVLILIIGGGIAGFLIYTINHQNNYNELSYHYNDNIPIVINRNNENPILVSQSGKVLSEKYSKIEEFSSDRSLAYYQNEDKTISAIIDNNGKEIFTTDKTLGKINDGQNFIFAESGKSYLLNKDGKKVDERPLRTVSYRNDQNYFLISDESNYAVIDNKGETKISGAVDSNNILSFTYANNKFDNNSYCAFIITRKKESKLYIYNCETANEVANIENIYYDASFPNVNSSFLETEQGSSYFYKDKMIYNSNTKDIELYGGIIQSTKDERYFNPVTQKSSESFPNESLIAQDKLSKKTTLSEDCDYTSHEKSKLIKICDNIYYNNKQLELNIDKFNFSLFDEKLDDFLSFNGKHYIYKEDKSKGTITIYDADNNKDIYTLDSRANNRESDSRFVSERKNEKIKVTDLATGKSAEYDENSYISLESNYYIVTTNDGEQKTTFYNSNHKQIYTDNN